MYVCTPQFLSKAHFNVMINVLMSGNSKTQFVYIDLSYDRQHHWIRELLSSDKDLVLINKSTERKNAKKSIGTGEGPALSSILKNH